jgi:acetyltransferase-like isoleucine patch superfamily enzyme
MLIKKFITLLKNRTSQISFFATLSDVHMEDYVGIRPMVKMERCEVGKCTSLGTLSAAYDTKIGRFCSIARECYIGGANHPIDRVSSSGVFYLKHNYTGKCYYEDDYNWHTYTEIGNDVWLGARAIIIGGVHISDGAVIGAGPVVTKDVGPYEIWAGNPARFIRKRFDDETINKLLKIKWWEWSDEKLYELGSEFLDVKALCDIED